MKMETNIVYQEDCIEGMKKIPSNSIDLVLTDPPYGITSNDWDKEVSLEQFWKQIKRILKEEGGVAITCSQPFTSKIIISNLELFKHEWIWQKDRGSNFANTMREPMKEHEHIVFFSKGKWKYNKQMQERNGTGLQRAKQQFHWKPKSENYRVMKEKKANSISDLRVPSSVQYFKCERGLHPTQKPLALFEYLVKTYSNENDVILDCFGGSGTTAIACIETNRQYILFENNSQYFKIINDRIKSAKSQTQLSNESYPNGEFNIGVHNGTNIKIN